MLVVAAAEEDDGGEGVSSSLFFCLSDHCRSEYYSWRFVHWWVVKWLIVSPSPPLLAWFFIVSWHSLKIWERRRGISNCTGGGVNGMLAEFVCRCEVIQHEVVGGRVLILCNARRYCEWYPYNFLESMKQRICPKRSLKSYTVLDVAKCRVHEKKYLTNRLMINISLSYSSLMTSPADE